MLVISGFRIIPDISLYRILKTDHAMYPGLPWVVIAGENHAAWIPTFVGMTVLKCAVHPRRLSLSKAPCPSPLPELVEGTPHDACLGSVYLSLLCHDHGSGNPGRMIPV